MSRAQWKLFTEESNDTPPEFSDFTQTYEGPAASTPQTVTAAAQVNDARNPTRDAPTQGVKTWLGVGTRDHFILPVPEMGGIDYTDPSQASAGKAPAKEPSFAQKVSTDIRGPTTTGPVDGVYQWPTPAPEMAPLPGPHPTQGSAPKNTGLLQSLFQTQSKTSSSWFGNLVQSHHQDIRGPSTDGPSAGVF